MNEYSNYNTQPKGWKEISGGEFSLAFFSYIFKEPESRQMHYDHEGNKIPYNGNTKLFEVAYSDWENMGVAMRWEYEAGKFYEDGQMKYFRFGEDERWAINESRFAAQFAGDNS